MAVSNNRYQRPLNLRNFSFAFAAHCLLKTPREAGPVNSVKPTSRDDQILALMALNRLFLAAAFVVVICSGLLVAWAMDLI